MKENEAEEEMELRAVRECEHQGHNAPNLFRIFTAESRKAKKPHHLRKIPAKQGIR